MLEDDASLFLSWESLQDSQNLTIDVDVVAQVEFDE